MDPLTELNADFEKKMKTKVLQCNPNSKRVHFVKEPIDVVAAKKLGEKKLGNELDKNLMHPRFIIQCNNNNNNKLNADADFDACDFLGAKKFGNKFLIGSNGNGGQARVEVDTLCGKIVGLYFAPLDGKSLPSIIRLFYDILKQKTKHVSFEMVYVALPPREIIDYHHYNSSVFNDFVSTLPCPAVPFDEEDWRYHLFHIYNSNNVNRNLDDSYFTFIDTRDDKVNVVGTYPWIYIKMYGPDLYPFTIERTIEVYAQYKQLGKQTSIKALLGSDSRDYLIDRHFNKVPISRLQNKDVLLYAYTDGGRDHVPFIKQLAEIYNKYWNHSFEIVFINFQNRFGYLDEKSFNDAFAEMPWLALPFGDGKVWSLDKLMLYPNYLRKNDEDWGEDPVLFVKPKGESLLDPYGYQVIQKFGTQAYPFTRHGVARSVVNRLKGLSFKSYVRGARHLGLDFHSLIRNKTKGETEHVSLSTITEKSEGGILLWFASSETCSPEVLHSLITAYFDPQLSPSFEVIFVSLDKDTQSFVDHFSTMPWFAFHKPLKRREYKKLAKRNLDFDFHDLSHFLAFGPDGLLLQVGMFTKSFENCEFPFINDAESANHLAYCISIGYGWLREADSTVSYRGYEWSKGFKWNFPESQNGLFG